MPGRNINPRDLGYYFALAQVGVEIVAPAGLGALFDYYVGTRPWGVVVGITLGFFGGLYHLVTLVKRHEQRKKQQEQQGKDTQ